MLKRLAQIAAYNKDWSHYVLGRSSPPDQVLTFRLRNGLRLELKRETRFLLNEIYLDRVYDLPGFKWSESGAVLDLGGNVGLFAFYVATRSPRARIYSFEPSSENLSLFRRNLEHNSTYSERISLLPMAVGAANGTATLSLTGSSAEFSTVLGDAVEGRKEIVRCVDLATAFDLCSVDEFDFAKIDIEGAETLVLDAASDQDIRRLKLMVIEWHHPTKRLQELATRLQGIGFDAHRVVIHGHMEFLHAQRK